MQVSVSGEADRRSKELMKKILVRKAKDRNDEVHVTMKHKATKISRNVVLILVVLSTAVT